MKPTHKQKTIPPNALIQSKDVEKEMKSSLNMSSFSFQVAAFSQSVEVQLENILHLELE